MPVPKREPLQITPRVAQSDELGLKRLATRADGNPSPDDQTLSHMGQSSVMWFWAEVAAAVTQGQALTMEETAQSQAGNLPDFSAAIGPQVTDPVALTDPMPPSSEVTNGRENCKFLSVCDRRAGRHHRPASMPMSAGSAARSSNLRPPKAINSGGSSPHRQSPPSSGWFELVEKTTNTPGEP